MRSTRAVAEHEREQHLPPCGVLGEVLGEAGRDLVAVVVAQSFAQRGVEHGAAPQRDDLRPREPDPRHGGDREPDRARPGRRARRADEHDGGDDLPGDVEPDASSSVSQAAKKLKPMQLPAATTGRKALSVSHAPIRLTTRNAQLHVMPFHSAR